MSEYLVIQELVLQCRDFVLVALLQLAKLVAQIAAFLLAEST
jgi:hypothetical protein